MDDRNRVRCKILASKSNELQCQHEVMKTALAMLTHIQELYGEMSRSVHYEVSERHFNAKMN